MVSSTYQYYNSADPYYAPSAPPMDHVDAENPLAGKNINLDDECCICLEGFRSKAPNDRRSYRLLSETECHHFFHELCLEQHLKQGVNKNCPLCRHPIKKVTHLNLDAPAPKPRVNLHDLPPYTHVHAGDRQDEEPVIDLVSDTAKIAADVGVGILSGLGSLTWSTMKFGGSALIGALNYGAEALSAASEQARQQAYSNKIVELYRLNINSFSGFETTMRSNREELKFVLTAIDSFPVVRRDEAQRSLYKIEKQLREYEQKLQELQTNFKTFLHEEKQILRIR
jgi:hypothetical protein